MGYPHSRRGIARNIVKNDLKRQNRKSYNGRILTVAERERLREDTGSAKERQSVFGASMKRARKTQAR